MGLNPPEKDKGGREKGQGRDPLPLKEDLPGSPIPFLTLSDALCYSDLCPLGPPALGGSLLMKSAGPWPAPDIPDLRILGWRVVKGLIVGLSGTQVGEKGPESEPMGPGGGGG